MSVPLNAGSPGEVPGLFPAWIKEIPMNIVIAESYRSVMRRFGLVAFAFFFIKGMLWLLAPFVFLLFV